MGNTDHPIASCVGAIIGVCVAPLLSGAIIYGVWTYLLPVFVSDLPALTFWQCVLAGLGLTYLRKFLRHIFRG